MSNSITSDLAYCGFSVQTLITPGSEWTSQEIKQDSLELNLEEDPRIISHHGNIDFWNRPFKTPNYFYHILYVPQGRSFILTQALCIGDIPFQVYGRCHWINIMYSSELSIVPISPHFVSGFKCTMQESTIFPLADKGLEISNKVLKCCSVITNMRKL